MQQIDQMLHKGGIGATGCVRIVEIKIRLDDDAEPGAKRSRRALRACSMCVQKPAASSTWPSSARGSPPSCCVMLTETDAARALGRSQRLSSADD